MKAITLWQPYASLIAWGEKQYETRPWATKYRGDIAIHAGKRNLGNSAPIWYEISMGHDLSEVPTGAVVAVARLVNIYIMNTNMVATMSDKEIANGNWAVGRYAWQLANIRTLIDPIPAKGAQGIWEWASPPAGLDFEREIKLPYPSDI